MDEPYGTFAAGSVPPTENVSGAAPASERPPRRGSRWPWVVLGCAGLLVLACACVGIGVVGYDVYRSVVATVTATAQAQQAATAPAEAGATPAAPTSAMPTRSPSPPRTSSAPTPPPQRDWEWFEDPSGAVALAVPSGWTYAWEDNQCCNVTLLDFDLSSLPSGRIDWGPPGSGADYEVPAQHVVLDLFLLQEPFATEPPAVGRAPEGYEMVGGRYMARLYYGAPFTDWPTDRAMFYLYTDDAGREWCLVVYFGSPFRQMPEQLSTVQAIIASIQHGS